MSSYSTDSQEHRVNIGEETDLMMEESLRDPVFEDDISMDEEYAIMCDYLDEVDAREAKE